MSKLELLTKKLLDQSASVIAGKTEKIKLIWVAILCNGHVLLEDLPGVGKTTLAQALAHLLGLKYQRIQFTADLLPSDILGAQIYDRDQQVFNFHKGPVFTQLLLADELNRATPKAQSALLEAMEEFQVSIDGRAVELPKPFFVIATQNPQSLAGTYPLPESQLDRFLIRLSLGYPDENMEKRLILGEVGRQNLKSLSSIFDDVTLPVLQKKVSEVDMTDVVLNYIMRLVHKTRDPSVCNVGLSPRGSQALAQASRALALVEGRNYVLPDDVQKVFEAVVGHRLKTLRSQSSASICQQILDSVDVLQE